MAEKKDSRCSSPREWIALITALVALATTIWNFTYTIHKTSEQETKIEKLAGCSGVTAKITEPGDGDEVEKRAYVNGETTPSEVCNHVFVVVRDKAGRAWKVADQVQANAAGQWYAVAEFGDVSHPGSDIDITAIVTSRPNDYTTGQFLSRPPDRGIRATNIVKVRRLR